MKLHINRAARAAYQIARNRDPALPEWDSVTDEHPVRAFAIRIAEAKQGAYVYLSDEVDMDTARAMSEVSGAVVPATVDMAMFTPGGPPQRVEWEGVEEGLQAITGIGPEIAHQLGERGITDLPSLVDLLDDGARMQRIADEVPLVTVDRLREWAEEARDLTVEWSAVSDRTRAEVLAEQDEGDSADGGPDHQPLDSTAELIDRPE
jgi:predicted flap endonuclease-1-like 5' DNA nuclease